MNIAVATSTIISKVYSDKKFLLILLLGLSSGLPAALTASTLQAWFTEAGINLHTIGAVTFLVLPYGIRFIWAPLFDHFKAPWLDRRRGWLLLSQVCLICTIVTMALLVPQQNLIIGSFAIPWLLIVGFLTAFFSTSQDILINAYQIEILKKEEQGLGASIFVTGWRVGTILSGAFGLVIASQHGWRFCYLVMAALMTIGIAATLSAPTTSHERPIASHSFKDLILGQFKEFIERFGYKTTLLFLLIIATYKVGDVLALALNTTFLLREVGFSLSTLGLINKTASIVSALLGGIVAGAILTRISLYRGLMIFGFLQAISCLPYILMIFYKKNIWLLVFTAFAENFCSGMGTIALLALIMSLCNIQYTASQFAFLSAMTFLPRIIVGPIAANIVESLGWLQFFIICCLISIPTLFFLKFNKASILQIKVNR